MSDTDRGLDATSNHFGMVGVTDLDGRVVNAATATFVRVDGVECVVTAGHVLKELSPLSSIVVQVPRVASRYRQIA